MVHTQLVALMLFFKCVQRLPFCFTYLTLSRYKAWSWLHIKNPTLGTFATFYWAEDWICLWNNLHKIFLVIYFLEQSWRKEIYATFRLPKCINVLQLPIVDTAAALYVAWKYLFDLSVDSLFLLFILLCILRKWKHKLNYCLHS